MLSLRKLTLVGCMLGLLIGLVACDALPVLEEEQAGLSASGVIEAVQVSVAAELGGRVVEVLVDEGQTVQIGDPLFRLEDEMLAAQRKQTTAAFEASQAAVSAADAAVALAETQLASAESAVELAQIEYEMARLAARQDELPARVESWDEDLPGEFDRPSWYFTKPDLIAAAQEEVQASQEAYEIELKNYDSVMQDASNDDLAEAEKRLAQAQAAFLVIEELQDRDIASQDKTKMDDFLDDLYDTAEAELESAQEELDRILSEQAKEDVLEAKARLAIAKERYETALDRWTGLLTGDQSLSVQAASASLQQVEDGVPQAQAMLAQAQAAKLQAEKGLAHAQATLDLIDVQLEKLTVRAAVSGVVMTSDIEPGEILQPGAVALTIGQIEELTVTVYIPEDRYGQISLGDRASVMVDSFPGQTFDATVVRIADKAEYTPRNVQTKEERSTTVFAVELSLVEKGDRLKPGMPADVVFTQK